MYNIIPYPGWRRATYAGEEPVTLLTRTCTMSVRYLLYFTLLYVYNESTQSDAEMTRAPLSDGARTRRYYVTSAHRHV